MKKAVRVNGTRLRHHRGHAPRNRSFVTTLPVVDC